MSRSAKSSRRPATYLVRSQGEFTNLDDIRNVAVMTRDGVPIYLRDIAEVVDSTEDRRQFLQIDGKPAVRMQVNKQTGENTVAVSAGIERKSSASTARCRVSA